MIKNILILTLVIITNFCYSSQEIYPEAPSQNPEQICSPNECYTIIKRLGEGAFGVVYAAQDSKGHTYAIKSYKSQDFDLTGSLGDAQREFSRGQILNHDNIIKSYELFSDSSLNNTKETYLVLQLVEGQTLFESSKGSLSGEQAIQDTIRFVNALQYAISLNLLHLDLHGGNIMINDLSDIMIIDLASFFAFDEVFQFVSDEQSGTPITKTIVAENQPKGRFAQQPKPISKQDLKLKDFFRHNNQLFGQLQKALQENDEDHSHLQVKMDTKKSLQKNYSLKIIAPLMHSYYDQISNICIDIITKSDLSRNEKMDLRIAIKMIAWNYTEDIEEEIYQPVDVYFDQLVDALQNY